MSSNYRFVVNVENGTVLYRSPVTDKYPILFRLIDDETAKAISSGAISGKVIADAALKKDMSDPNFDYSEYDKKRQAVKKARCMSSREMIPMTETVPEIKVEEHPEAVLSASDLGLTEEPKKVETKASKASVKKDDAGGY